MKIFYVGQRGGCWKPGDPQEGLASLSPVEGEEMKEFCQERSKNTTQLQKFWGKSKESLQAQVTHKERVCHHRNSLAKQALCNHKGGFGRQRWDNASIPSPCQIQAVHFMDITLPHPIISNHISNLPTIVERLMCLSTTLSIAMRKNTKYKKFTKFKAVGRSLLELLADGQCNALWLFQQLFVRSSEHVKNSLPDLVRSPLTRWTTVHRVCIMLSALMAVLWASLPLLFRQSTC